jgi:hypothetical protein
MPTHCIQDSLDFGRVEGRAVVADFSGGTISPNAGALLLARADQAAGIIDSFAAGRTGAGAVALPQDQSRRGGARAGIRRHCAALDAQSAMGP